MCGVCGTGGSRRPDAGPCRGVAMAHGVARRRGVPVGSSRDRPSIRSLARWRRRQRFAGGASSGRWSWRRHRAGGEAGGGLRGPGEGSEWPGVPPASPGPLFSLQAPRSRRGPRAAGVRRAAAGGGRRPRERQNPHGEGGRGPLWGVSPCRRHPGALWEVFPPRPGRLGPLWGCPAQPCPLSRSAAGTWRWRR